MSSEKVALVHFELDDMDVEVPLGTHFVDIVDATGADVTFGCKNGTCGTCKILVSEGFENLSAPNQEEIDFLHSLEAEPLQRLGCQIKIFGNVRISQ
jgi:ferredoxin